MTRPRGTNPRLLVAASAAVVVLAGASTVVIAAANGAFDTANGSGSSSCLAPSLPGTTVDVSLIDMSGMGGMMRGGQSGWRGWRAGMMRVAVSPQVAPHGVISFRVFNTGVIKHELVVLPLTGRQPVGSRAVGQDGTVDETGSLAEASAPCDAGIGDGLTPGSTGWTTVTLPAGRYELLCNLPGHYAAGMHTELDIT